MRSGGPRRRYDEVMRERALGDTPPSQRSALRIRAKRHPKNRDKETAAAAPVELWRTRAHSKRDRARRLCLHAAKSAGIVASVVQVLWASRPHHRRRRQDRRPSSSPRAATEPLVHGTADPRACSDAASSTARASFIATQVADSFSPSRPSTLSLTDIRAPSVRPGPRSRVGSPPIHLAPAIGDQERAWARSREVTTRPSRSGAEAKTRCMVQLGHDRDGRMQDSLR